MKHGIGVNIVALEEFSFYQIARPTRGGEVGVYVKEGLSFVEVHEEKSETG